VMLMQMPMLFAARLPHKLSTLILVTKKHFSRPFGMPGIAEIDRSSFS